MRSFLVVLKSDRDEIEYYPVQAVTIEKAIKIVLDTMSYSDDEWEATEIFERCAESDEL